MSSLLVVIVDDRLTNLKILERLAQSLGADVAVKGFTDPLTASAECISGGADLLVIDYRTPHIDGADIVGALRVQPGGADVPVIVIVDAEDRDLRQKALDAGATDTLSGPVEHREFRARAGTLLALRRSERRNHEHGAVPDPDLRDADRRREEALAEAHDRLLRVLDAVPMMIVATDRDGRYVFVNNRFASFVGARPRQLIGRHPDEARSDPFSCRLRERDIRILAGDVTLASHEEEGVDAAGASHVLLTTKSLFHGDDGEPRMVVTVSLDVTARKNAELDLLAAKERAEIADRSKTEFLANMSHELRTPLNAILGFSQVMAGEMLGPIANERYVGYAQDIVVSAEHLLGTINDLLDVSRLEAGSLELSESWIDLPYAVGDLLLLVENRVRSAEITVALHAERTLPLLYADSRKVKQILMSLIGNAIKFSHPGGNIEIGLRADAGAVVVLVVDHGIGMDEGEVRSALASFGHVANVSTRRHAGAGLGLPLAIGLMELHGGHLHISSRKDVGTTVTITFPPHRSRIVPEDSDLTPGAPDRDEPLHFVIPLQAAG